MSKKIFQTKRNNQISITDYGSLLSAAKSQAEPQRLLFVFLTVSLPKDHKHEEAVNFHAGQGGELEPVMCVDKTLDELGSFTDLVTESRDMEKDWDIVLVASLSGKNGIAPTSDEATEPLKRMIQMVEQGGNLSSFLAFNKEGDPLRFDS